MPQLSGAGEARLRRPTAAGIRAARLTNGGYPLARRAAHLHPNAVWLESEGFLFVSGNRTSLLEAIRENSKTVILGANSFWEGIDIAGDNLSLLIIVKLPFWPPDMPTIAAKLEQMEAERRNSFMELSLPQAVIRFKQGFGRLIRKEDDRGVICVLDRRIYEKRYGSQFINSLPVKKLYPLTVEEIAGIIEKKL